MPHELCRHQGCTCAAKSDGYCSAYCAAATADAGAAGSGPCACGHDQCQPPTKGESRMDVAEIAPEGRFIGKYSRDW